MDDLLEKYFEKIFSSLFRESLVSRNKRFELVEHFKKTIETLSSACDVTKEVGCRIAVAAIIRYHQKNVAKNGTVCLFGKYHNVLYLAVKLCFDFRLSEEIVSILLKEIFQCENSFKRILAGAIYGISVAHFIAGWKSDFRDQKENISAVAYFLEEANKQKLVFRVKTDSGIELRKLADVPISPWNRAPLLAALQMFNTEIVLLLLRFDATLSFQFFEIYPPDEEICEKELECVRILSRTVPTISDTIRKNSKFEDLPAAGLSDLVLPRLKHLCRCKIRNLLGINSMLPLGIQYLGLPKSVVDYLDLLLD